VASSALASSAGDPTPDVESLTLASLEVEARSQLGIITSGRAWRTAVARTCGVIFGSVIPLPRAWLLASAMLVGIAVGQIAAIASTLLVKATIRPDVAVALVIAVPSVLGMLLILFSGRRWGTALGAFILGIAPGWFGVLVAIQVVHGA
jgi:hypothetical protein